MKAGGGVQSLALQQLKRNLKSKYPKTRTREEVCALVCKTMNFPVEMLDPKVGESS